ncbi:MAG: hypothetical protein U9R26_06505 [Campylobacterota bacterium]|nr:hypothetical protein [Campylobacterota bacterium]
MAKGDSLKRYKNEQKAETEIFRSFANSFCVKSNFERISFALGSFI